MDEFKNLYHSLFDSAQNYINIVHTLAKKGKALTRNEIIDACKLTSGGYCTQSLNELIESGFISSYIPFAKTSKDASYKLTDEYSLLYPKFIKEARLWAVALGSDLLREIHGKVGVEMLLKVFV